MKNIAKKKTYIRAKIHGYSFLEEYHSFVSVVSLLSFLREKFGESGKLTIQRGVGDYADRYHVTTDSGEIIAEFQSLPKVPVVIG